MKSIKFFTYIFSIRYELGRIKFCGGNQIKYCGLKQSRFNKNLEINLYNKIWGYFHSRYFIS